MSRIFVLLLVLLAPWAVHGQELTKAQDGLLKRVTKQVGDIKTQLDGFRVDQKFRFTQRVAEDLNRKVGRLEQQLQPLPAELEAVQAELKRLTTLKQAIADKFAAVGELDRTLGARPDAKPGGDPLADAVAARALAAKTESASVAAIFIAPEFADDLTFVKTVLEMFKSAGRFEFNHYLYKRWPTHSIIEETRGWTESYKDNKAKLEALQAKYGPALEQKVRLNDNKAEFARTDMKIALNDIQRFREDFQTAIDSFTKAAPEQLGKWAEALKAETNKAVSQQDFAAFLRNEGTIEQGRYRVINLAAVYKPLAASDAERAQIDSRVKAIQEETDATMAKLSEVIIRENRAPAEQYTRDDRKQLESYVRGVWAKKFPKEEVLAVRFGAAAFERQTSWQFRPGSNSMVKVDRSRLPVWMIVKDGTKQAIMWYCTLYKQHMAGDTLELDWIDRPSKGAPPDRRLFASHL